MMIPKKFHIKTGDTVLIVAGNEKGKKGEVIQVDRKKYRAVVKGANIVTKNLKPKNNTPGNRITKEASIHLSNLMLVIPSTGKAERIGRKYNEDGKLQRYSKKTGEFISND